MNERKLTVREIKGISLVMNREGKQFNPEKYLVTSYRDLPGKEGVRLHLKDRSCGDEFDVTIKK